MDGAEGGQAIFGVAGGGACQEVDGGRVAVGYGCGPFGSGAGDCSGLLFEGVLIFIGAREESGTG